MLGLGRNASDSSQKDGVLPKINSAYFQHIQRLKATIPLEPLTRGISTLTLQPVTLNSTAPESCAASIQSFVALIIRSSFHTLEIKETTSCRTKAGTMEITLMHVKQN